MLRQEAFMRSSRLHRLLDCIAYDLIVTCCFYTQDVGLVKNGRWLTEEELEAGVDDWCPGWKQVSSTTGSLCTLFSPPPHGYSLHPTILFTAHATHPNTAHLRVTKPRFSSRCLRAQAEIRAGSPRMHAACVPPRASVAESRASCRGSRQGPWLAARPHSQPVPPLLVASSP